MSGLEVGRRLMTGRSVVQKVAVLPLSAISELVSLGGPGAVGRAKLKQLLVELSVGNGGAQGSPRPHVSDRRGRPPDMIRSLPPRRLSAVAASL
jgi:hypothetical protein